MDSIALKNVRRILSVVVAGLSALLLAPCSSAQSFQAQITGVVKDSSGGVVPGATLTATNIATGVKSSNVSNSEGVYRLQALPPAEYRVTCELSGFKRFEQGPIALQVNQVFALDITLQPGQTSEQVTVTGAPPPLETASATLGQVVTTRSIENLPLNVRDPLALVGLTPGVTFGPNFGNGGGQDVGRNFFKSDFNVGGGRSGSQEILLDGAPDTTSDINRGVIDPPVDSVQEFKVQANSYDAQFGRTSGGVVNVITKSGTNALHGVAYDFERHSVMDANNFFNNRSGLGLSSFQRHQFGGNLGGAVLKNKWFFFGDYEGLRQGYPTTSITTVPSALQRQGDFSQTYASNGSLITIYDPNTLVTLPNGSRQRSPFDGNVIRPDRFDPVAANTLQFFPAPNIAGNPVTGQNNYIYSAKSITNSDKYDLRTDANFTESTRMFFRFSRQQDLRSVPGNLPLPIGGGRNTSDHYTQAVADLTHVISPSTVADMQFSFTRALASQVGASQGFNLSSLGFPAAYLSQVQSQFPVFNIGDTVGTSNGSDSFTQFQPRNMFSTLGSVSYLRGKHSFKFGGDWRILDFNEAQNTSASGTYSFGRTFTQGPNPIQSSAAAGYGFASFLLGDAASGTVRQINPISTQGFYYAAFAQDDWHVTDKLTLNLGLRWDVSIGNREKYDRLAYLDLGTPNPLGPPAGLPDLQGVLGWIGERNSLDQQNTDWINFGPRFGLAYSIDSKTVLRGGYAIFFLPKTVQGNGDGAIEAFRDTPMVATIDGVTPANRLSNPFPQGILPPLNDRDPLANVGASVGAPTRDYRNGYSQTWSFGIQRELPFKLLLDVHYWGNKGTGLLTTWNINQIPNQYLALGSKLNDKVTNPFYGLIATGALSGPTTSRQQLLRPYPQYSGDSGVQQVFVSNGNSTYHAGTIQIERRLATNLTFLAAYTRSKAIDDVRTPHDYYNRTLEKGLSSFDAPNQFVLSGVYQLPFGRGRKFGQQLNPVLNAIVGNWDLDGILRIQSGQPIGISRPSVNNGQSAKLANPGIGEWFDTSAFTVAAPFTFGNVGPVLPDVRTDGMRNLDAVLVKNFSFSIKDKQITAQLRGEFYNLFNHPQFASPNTSVSSQSFGQVTSQANNARDIQIGLKVKF
jgi:outer membrane receptor protein involved in Fe transport